ncbi:MAG TPA: lysozyme [Tissierellaceae bacterium]|nr:lysozyme [Tissierellaceae bacterium]
MGVKRKLTKRLAALGVSVAAALSGGYLIYPYEGSVTNKDGLHTVYLDPIGIPTACWGQTGRDLYGKPIQMGATYTEDECIQMLANTLKSFEQQINQMTKNNYASDWQKAALISFAYNSGTGNFQRSTLRSYILAGDHGSACDQLSRWVYANKKKLRGLVLRRGEEREWCLGNVDDAAAIGTYYEIMEKNMDYFKKYRMGEGSE